MNLLTLINDVPGVNMHSRFMIIYMGINNVIFIGKCKNYHINGIYFAVTLCSTD